MKLKRMVMVLLTVVALMGMSFASPVMADEVEDKRNDSSSAGLGVRDHPDDSSDSSNSTSAEKEPLKDPGIRLCDITPTECQDTAEEDSTHKTPRGSGGEYSEYCKLPTFVYDPACDKKNNEHNDKDGYPGYCKYQTFAYDPACDKNNEHSQDSEDSQDEQGPNSGARPDAKDPNPGEEEEPTEESKEKEESSAPGAVKAAEEVPGGTTKTAPKNAASDPKEAVSASDEAGQIANSGQLANSPTTYGCPFDYEYYELWDVCRPGLKDLPLLGTVTGNMPAPDSFGGYVSLLGHLPSDVATGLGFGVQVMLGHYVGDGLVGWGEDVVGPVGYGLQGVGYTVGFASDAAGVFLEGAGEIVGAAADGVGEVVDAVADNIVYPVLGGVVEAVNNSVETVVESVEKVADAVGSTAKKVFCKIFC